MPLILLEVKDLNIRFDYEDFFYTILFVFYVYVSQKKLNSFFANVCFDLRIADYDKILMHHESLDEFAPKDELPSVVYKPCNCQSLNVLQLLI